MAAEALRLYGRESELLTIAELLRAAQTRRSGGVLAIRGEAGVGKSSLLAAARLDAKTPRDGDAECVRRAVRGAARVRRAAPGRAAALGPDRPLPIPQREALKAAFGMTDAAAPELFLIALATLELLADAATSTRCW